MKAGFLFFDKVTADHIVRAQPERKGRRDKRRGARPKRRSQSTLRQR